MHDDEGVLAVRHEEPGGRDVHRVLAVIDRRDQERPLAKPFVIRAVGREPVGDLDLDVRSPSVPPCINTPSETADGPEGADRGEDIADERECFDCRHHRATPFVVACWTVWHSTATGHKKGCYSLDRLQVAL